MRQSSLGVNSIPCDYAYYLLDFILLEFCQMLRSQLHFSLFDYPRCNCVEVIGAESLQDFMLPSLQPFLDVKEHMRHSNDVIQVSYLSSPVIKCLVAVNKYLKV